MTDLLPPGDVQIARICGQRDAAIAKIREASALMERAATLADEARAEATTAAGGAVFSLVDRSQDAAFRRLFISIDAKESTEMFRRHVDASVWTHVFRATGLEHLMDATAREEFSKGLSTFVPEVTEENIRATIDGARGDAKLIFGRGIARAFSELDRRFRSHDAFKIGARMVLTNVFDQFGSLNSWSRTAAMLADVERVLAILDGQTPDPGAMMRALEASRTGWGPRQGVCETPYLRIRTFKNGNAHLWFTRDDLVEKANLVLADYYGAVLPDAVPRDDVEIRSRSGLPSKDLAFYATPKSVVDALVRDLRVEPTSRVLEPSAGEGAIVDALLRFGCVVDAVEIDPGRVSRIRANPRLTVIPANFLRLAPRAEYDAVVMNPPFCGTHWMEHVVHAFEFLRPGGVLRAVLPATAEVAETAKHEAFRAWASKRASSSWRMFTSLPSESFASSGTRISTVILELHR